ncbi:MAG: hypothetical protein H0U62_00470 [Actinobacteria bacterium]|nr:hypothetical protein [Actinomycetota bacterium]
MSEEPGDRGEQVLATCAQLSLAELTHPFGEQTAVLKVASSSACSTTSPTPPRGR